MFATSVCGRPAGRTANEGRAPRQHRPDRPVGEAHPVADGDIDDREARLPGQARAHDTGGRVEIDRAPVNGDHAGRLEITLQVPTPPSAPSEHAQVKRAQSGQRARRVSEATAAFGSTLGVSVMVTPSILRTSRLDGDVSQTITTGLKRHSAEHALPQSPSSLEQSGAAGGPSAKARPRCVSLPAGLFEGEPAARRVAPSTKPVSAWPPARREIRRLRARRRTTSPAPTSRARR